MELQGGALCTSVFASARNVRHLCSTRENRVNSGSRFLSHNAMCTWKIYFIFARYLASHKQLLLRSWKILFSTMRTWFWAIKNLFGLFMCSEFVVRQCVEMHSRIWSPELCTPQHNYSREEKHFLVLLKGRIDVTFAPAAKTTTKNLRMS